MSLPLSHVIFYRWFTALSCCSYYFLILGRSFSANKAFNMATVAKHSEELVCSPNSAMFTILTCTFNAGFTCSC